MVHPAEKEFRGNLNSDNPETTIAAPEGTAIDLLPHMVDEALLILLSPPQLVNIFRLHLH